MTAYTAITNGEIDQDSPATQPLFTSLRDNPIAITEGASGAPRVVDAALDTTATSTGCTWVRNRYALMTALDWGTVLLASNQGVAVATITPGTTTAGSNLLPASASGAVGASSPSGTWMALGRCETATSGAIPLSDPRRVTLWIRVG